MKNQPINENLKNANEYYFSARAKFKLGDKLGAYGIFKLARNEYQKVAKDTLSSPQDIALAAKRLAKLEDKGKYGKFVFEPSAGPQKPFVTQDQIINMFDYCREGNLEAMKQLHVQGVPLNICHPYHNATLIHFAVVTGKLIYACFNHCHVEILNWLLPQLLQQNQLYEILQVKILVNPNQKMPDNLKPTSYLASGYQGKTAIESFDHLYNVYMGSGPNSFKEARGWRDKNKAAQLAAIRNETNTSQKQLTEAKALLNQYSALAKPTLNMP